MDREKVIRGLERCVVMGRAKGCDDCPYLGEGLQCADKLRDDIRWLISEQEARPIYTGYAWVCSECREMYRDILEVRRFRYCPGCGRRLIQRG